MDELKTLTVRISSQLHKAIKITSAKKGISLKDYLVGLIEKDLYGEVDKKKEQK